ncbi:Aldo ket red domain containing protein [Trichuris trichiura]|uniref:Aldo ket red domain containing protein n=1 Tax=Trichuris trichiura TaxID=36087 RepID=A0A077ZDK2_TRITR|nr:Aldo ket red domain containing protein [Trichuris trichiura]
MSSKFITLHNGVRMPTMGYGTWLAEGEPLRAGVKKALEVGYRHIDTAYLYQNEDIIGDVLKQWFEAGLGKREDIFITTKLSAKYHRRPDVERSLKESLEMLKLDYVDLFLVHTPMGNKCSDRGTLDIVNDRCLPDPVDHLETWQGMEDVMNKGLTRAIGLSNFSIPQMQRILDNCSVECHIYLPQYELHDFCQKQNISFTAYAPIGSPGRRTNPLTMIDIDVSEQSEPLDDPLVKDIAAKHGKTSAQVLLKWLLQRDMIVIPKSTTAAHIIENFQVFNFELSSEEMKMLNEMSSKYVTLHNGVQMPMLGYGTWLVICFVNSKQAEGELLYNGLKKALDVGYRHIDTAYVYENEDTIGDVLKQWFDSGSGKREDIFITTKLSPRYHQRPDVERSLKESLEKLKLNHVDLFLIHTPVSSKRSDGKIIDAADRIDPLETWQVSFFLLNKSNTLTQLQGMEDVLNKGLTRAIGLSNFSVSQTQRILDKCSVKPHNVQVECHIYWPQFELHDFCKEQSISFTAYTPLGNPGRHARLRARIGANVMRLQEPLNDESVKDIAAKHGKSPAQILLKWLLQRDMIVIPKSTNPVHILENFQLFDFELSDDEMNYAMPSKCVTLHNGLPMPLVGYGTWQGQGDALRSGLKKALEVGYRHIDTAYVYENEDIIGEVLQQWFASGAGKREDLFVTTKLPMHNHRRPDVERSLKESLGRLKLDYVDLFLVHTPLSAKSSDGKKIDMVNDHCVPDNVDHLETWRVMHSTSADSVRNISFGMEDVLSKGLTRSIGLSNFNITQMVRIMDSCTVKPHNLQVECHLYWPQFELHEFCKRHSISFTAYSPIGSPGRRNHPLAVIGVDVSKQREPLDDPLAKQIATKHGKSVPQVLMKWLIQRDIIVIPKSTNPSHIVSNFQLFDFELNDAEMKALNEVQIRQRIAPFLWCELISAYCFASVILLNCLIMPVKESCAMPSKCVTLHNGLPMPLVGYGTWQGQGDALRSGLKKALEVGYRHIDTAYVYENEDIIGEVLQQWFASGAGKREDLFVTTKLPMHNHRRPDVERSLKESLGRLKLDYVDLFLVHAPLSAKTSDGKRADFVNDHVVPDNVDHLETWKGMEDVLSKGLTRSIGLSNFNITQMARVTDNCTVKPHNLQVECHLYWPQFELHEFCKRHNVSFTAYSPIGSPGRGSHPWKQHEPLNDPLAKQIATKHGKSVSQSTNPSHIASNFQLFDFELNDAEMKALNEVKIRERIFPFLWCDLHFASVIVLNCLIMPVQEGYAMPSKCVTLHNGLPMPLLGYGTWQAQGDALRSGLKKALDVGFRHIDTAYLYENEGVIGEVLQQWFASGAGKREDVFVTTKLPWHYHRRADVERSLKESLGKLKLDYVDLFLVHTPLSTKASDGGRLELVNDLSIPDNVDHLETWRAMEDVLSKGLTRSIGLSNFNISQIVRVMDNCTVKPHNLQVECHIYLPQFELHEFCKRHNISFTAYSPIGSPGRGSHPLSHIGVDISKQREPLNDPLAKQIATKHGKSASQARILLKWLLQRDIIVIPKSTNPSHIVSNFQLFDFELNDAEMKALNEVKIRQRIFPFLWCDLVTQCHQSALLFITVSLCQWWDLERGRTYAYMLIYVFVISQSKGDALRSALREALEVGYRLIDTAYNYENEDIIGEVLQQWFASGAGKREDVFVTTKLPEQNHRRADVERSLKESLENLKLDYVDLFLASDGRKVDLVNDHCVPDNVDYLETWRGMEDVLSKGLTRSIGLSNFNISQIARVLDSCTVKPHNLQVQFDHLFRKFCGSMNSCRLNVIFIGLSLSFTNSAKDIIYHLLRSNMSHLMTHWLNRLRPNMENQYLRWLLQRDIIIIPRSTNPSHIVSNFQLFDFELTDAEIKALNEVQIRQRIFPFLWCELISADISYATSSKHATLRNGVLMPMVGYGTWQVTFTDSLIQPNRCLLKAHGDALRNGLRKALDVGCRHIDTAYIYQNEDVIGEVLQQWFASGAGKREDVFVVTKVLLLSIDKRCLTGMQCQLPWHSRRRDEVEKSLRESLARLKLDYVDLYLVHSPQRGAGMEDVFSKRLTRSIGISNFNIDQITNILDNSKVKPQNLQVECHLYWPQFELHEFCKRHNISFTAYAPLGSPGRYGRPTNILLKWLLQRDIIVIPKSTNPSHILLNVQLFDFELSDAEMKALNEAHGDALRTGLRKALDVGCRHIDTAHLYQNEDVIGEVLQQWFTSGAGKREDVFVVTKGNNYLIDMQRQLPWHSRRRDDVERSLRESLARLQLDYVDLYLGMEDVFSKGLTRSIGISNFNIDQITNILDNSKVKPHNLQVECHLYWPQFELHEFCKRHNISFTAYSPLGRPGQSNRPANV